MEKTLKIDGKKVKFKMNAAFGYLYENQFTEDILQVLLPLLTDAINTKEGEEYKLLSSLSMVKIQNIIWVMAKLADEDIDEPVKWYASFKDFPVATIGLELLPIFLESFISKKKVTKKAEKE